MKNYLNFENDIKSLENEIEKLKDPYNLRGLSEVDTQKISKIQKQNKFLKNSTYPCVSSHHTDSHTSHHLESKNHACQCSILGIPFDHNLLFPIVAKQNAD